LSRIVLSDIITWYVSLLQVRQVADTLDDADVAAISALPGLMGMPKVYRAGDDIDSQMYGKKNALAVAMIMFSHMTPDQVVAMLGMVVPGKGVLHCYLALHAMYRMQHGELLSMLVALLLSCTEHEYGAHAMQKGSTACHLHHNHATVLLIRVPLSS
jgi:hypothetical protein